MPTNNYILSIAIDKYSDSILHDLDNAVFDSERFQDVLTRKYGFGTIHDPLYNQNATRRNIIDSLNNLASSILTNDNLIIYYAGHGRVNPKNNKGFWIPYDGENYSTSNYISNSDILDILSTIDAKHILLISDSCFSGSFLTKSRGMKMNQSYIKLGSKNSRYVFASGRNEEVLDGKIGSGSPFANALIEYFERNTNMFFSFTEVAGHVKKEVGDNYPQQPIYGVFGDFKDGEMIFELKPVQKTTIKSQENIRSWESNFNLFIEAKSNRPEWPFISKENAETKSLGIWCAEQRKYKRNNKLSPSREQRLLSAGFIFDPQMEKFFTGMKKFLIFMEKERGHNYVPNHLINKYREEDAWLRTQQKWYRKSPCDPTNSKSYPFYRYEWLRKVGIILIPETNAEKWEKLKQDVIEYYKSHEPFLSLPSQNDKDPKIASLGNRINDTMVLWKNKKISQDKIKFLEQFIDINYGQNKVRRQFLSQIQEYLDFKVKFPNSEPKQGGRYNILASRIAVWKSKKKKGKLSTWQEDLLRKHKVPIEGEKRESNSIRLF